MDNPARRSNDALAGELKVARAYIWHYDFGNGPASDLELAALNIEAVIAALREPEITVTDAMLDAAIEAADNKAKTLVKDDAFAAAFGVSSVAGFLCRVMRVAIEAALKARKP